MINVTLGEKPKEEKPFPKLMVISKLFSTDDNGTIVFMNDKGEGQVVYGCGDYKNKIGYVSDSWNIDHFTDYNEPITIQNA